MGDVRKLKILELYIGVFVCIYILEMEDLCYDFLLVEMHEG